MLKVITLVPPATTPASESLENAAAKRHASHILTQLQQKKSGRLDCEDEADIEIPDLEIYAAR
jgi:hypothetical protein